MAKEEDFKPQVQTWLLKVHINCKGCKKEVKKLLDSIDGVNTTTIDLDEQKVTVRGNVASADILLKKLQNSGRHAELWPVAQNKQQDNEQKTPQQQKQQKAGKGGRQKSCKEHSAAPKGGKDKGDDENSGGHVNGRGDDNGQLEEHTSFGHRIKVFKMETLAAATDNFHDDNKLGAGAFGPVYRGIMRDGTQIAVKKLSSTSEQGRKEFLNEIELLDKIQHRNFVKLLGCCAKGSEKLLVYEYLPNKSLDKFLLDADKRKNLDWQKRFKIILGVARGLLYLHEDSPVRIVHRDIKPSNILLDEKLHPKIADFGIAKPFPKDETHLDTVAAGSRGYMPPEFHLGGQLTAKADVYSFGVVLLELMTGRTILDDKKEFLLKWVWNSYKQRNIGQTIDPAIIETCDEKQLASKCIHVGLLCTQADSSLRPLMSEVVAMLSIDPKELRAPTVPAYVTSAPRLPYASVLTPSVSQIPLAPPSNADASITNLAARRKKDPRK